MKDITIQKFKQNIYDMGLLSCNKKIAIAVSGGPDSVALLILSKTCFYDSTKIIALTFNHNLRENSSTESSQVHELCRSLDIEHHIFEWQHNDIKNNSIEASAREARYESMTKFCKENDICSLLVGHTLDDKIENFFIRLSRGSGIHGLSSNNNMVYNSIKIFRPLHNFEKDELINFLNLQKINFSVDESNLNPKFSQRNEIRYKLESFLESNFIDKKLYKRRIIKSLDLLDQAYSIIKLEFNNFINSKVEISHLGFASIKISNIAELNQHILFYVLSYLLTIIGGNNFTPKSFKVENLIELILSLKLTRITLHNCCVMIKNHEIVIYKEQNKKYLYQLEQNLLIDNRFFLNIEGIIDREYFVTNFSTEDYKGITDDINFKFLIKNNFKNVKNILFTLPVLKDLENRLIIPHINYSNAHEEFSTKITFMPRYVSKFMF